MKTSNLYPPTSDPRPPMVSVVVTTKNEERNIEHCMKSIKLQSYENIEIIVVDNFSADKTKEIALKYTNKVYDKGPERSAQRNFGVEKSKGEYFLYLDSDMILSENVIKDCVEKIRNNSEAIALYISETVMGEKFFSKVRSFERSFYDATVIDAARFIKRKPFQAVGGFDENLTGTEDWDLDKKLRSITGKVELIKEPIYHNETDLDLRNYLNKKKYYSAKFDNYINKWGRNDTDLRKQFGIYYRFIGVFVEKGKWKKLINHPILVLGMALLRFLVGFQYLIQKILKCISQKSNKLPSIE